MTIFDRYFFKNLAIATLFIAIILAFIVFLTQSLRFLELVINSGNSGGALWILTLLALPRFFEVILPISIMTATLFIYNKMTIDSEITAIRALGYSPMALARPALYLAAALTLVLWAITMWISPASMSTIQKKRLEMTAEFSNILFREGIFNAVGRGLTVYIKDRTTDGEMAGLMIHDTRDEHAPPTTILAKRGIIVLNKDAQQVVVFEGSKQEFDKKNNILQKLTFDRYTIELPDSNPVKQRWAEPDERNILELLNPDLQNPRDVKNIREFSIEIHKRITGPLLAFALPIIALTTLVLGPMDRRGQARRIALALVLAILVQGLFLVSYNMARNSNTGFILMYILTLAPIALGLFALSTRSENLRRNVLYNYKKRGTAA